MGIARKRATRLLEAGRVNGSDPLDDLETVSSRASRGMAAKERDAGKGVFRVGGGGGQRAKGGGGGEGRRTKDVGMRECERASSASPSRVWGTV
jgi:hypothetical protein